MTRAKANFNGDDAWSIVDGIRDRDGLRKRLAALDPTNYTDAQVTKHRLFVAAAGSIAAQESHPSDEFINELLHAAHMASSRLHWCRFEVDRQDVRAEIGVLRETLAQAADMLRSISSTVDRVIPLSLDPRELADSIDAFAKGMQPVDAQIDRLPAADRPSQVQRSVADELATNVLGVFKANGISIAASVDAATGKASIAIQVIEEVGEAIGLVRSRRTWLKSVQRANAPQTRGP